MPRKRLENLESRGEVHSEHDFFGKRRFNPSELDAIKRKLDRPTLSPARARAPVSGKAAATAFRMFGQGSELRAIVLELELTPDQVTDLRLKYAQMGRDLLVSPAELEQLRELLDWKGDTGAGLVKRINERLRYQFDRGRQTGITEATEQPQRE